MDGHLVVPIFMVYIIEIDVFPRYQSYPDCIVPGKREGSAEFINIPHIPQSPGFRGFNP